MPCWWVRHYCLALADSASGQNAAGASHQATSGSSHGRDVLHGSATPPSRDDRTPRRFLWPREILARVQPWGSGRKSRPRATARLTPELREELLAQLAAGDGFAEAASAVGVSPRTVASVAAASWSSRPQAAPTSSLSVASNTCSARHAPSSRGRRPREHNSRERCVGCRLRGRIAGLLTDR